MEYLLLLRNRNFSKLWFAQIFSQIGQNLLNFSLIILVFDLAQGTRFANLAVALLVIAFGLPALLFAPIAGTYVDYWDRRKILVISNILRVALVLMFIKAEGSLLVILILSFLLSTILNFFVPAETATIPDLVPPNLLLVANSLFIFSLYASFIVGYSTSGPVVSLLGNHGPYWAVAVMFAIAAVLSALLPKLPVDRPAGSLPKPDLARHMKDNWKLVRSNGERFFAILQLTIIQALIAILVTLAPALSLSLLHIPLQKASHVLIIPVGVGMVLGVLFVGSVTKMADKISLIQTSLIIAGLTLTAVGLSGQLWRTDEGNQIASLATISLIVGVLMFILGFMNALISATAQTLLQESTSNQDRGKVFASLNMMVNIASTAPILFTGILADLLSVTRVISILGALLTVYAIYMIWHWHLPKAATQPE